MSACDDPIKIKFSQGTLLLQGKEACIAPIASWVKWDDRVHLWRAEGRYYGDIVLTLHRLRLPYMDQAREFSPQTFAGQDDPLPRPYQMAALQAWQQAKKRGVVVLPTGAGKSLVARMAILAVQRNTLILVPTIDLMSQWQNQLHQAFQQPIGQLGAGERIIQPLTVSTYDSAFLLMESIGNRFGLLICDECHHLPSPSNRLAASMCIAPYRLGLTATPERSDGLEEDIYQLLGPICHRIEINELEGGFLAPYHLETIPVQLEDDERTAYTAAYGQYRQFIQSQGISPRAKNFWQTFLQVAARSMEGRAALRAWYFQKNLIRSSRAKIKWVWQLLRRHRQERILIFTDDNAMAYILGELFFLPVLTHVTKQKERKLLLDQFRAGTLPYLVTSRILNEGVDVPEVAVGIIVSGTASVREHVQRLGRILRPQPGKEAILYELVSDETGETYTSERRRQHAAYQR